MVIFRAFLSLLAGFVTIAVLVTVATAALAKLVPEWVGKPSQPRTGYVFVNLGYSFAAAMAGGYVTAWIASLNPQANPLIQSLVLALIVMLLAALSAMQQRGQQPIWYQLLIIAITPIGVVAGGLIRLRVLGIW